MILLTRNALLPLMFVLLITTCNADEFPPKTLVQMTNNLGANLDITVHCKSKDDDLGAQLLNPSGTFEFRIVPSFEGITQFFCRMEWPGVFHYFDIDITIRDRIPCNLNCLWSIIPEGPCMFNKDTSKYDICYPWNPQ